MIKFLFQKLWNTDMLTEQSQKALTTFQNIQAGSDAMEIGPVDGFQFGNAVVNQSPRFPGHFTE